MPSSLTSATLSLAGLLVLGVVHPPDLSSSWISWWIGDTLGVLLVLPLMLVIAGEPRTLWRGRARAPRDSDSQNDPDRARAAARV